MNDPHILLIKKNMFNDAIAFNQDISGWKVGAVTNMNVSISKKIEFLLQLSEVT